MTSSGPKIILILGAGPNIGAALAKAFSAKGYQVASASRTPPKNNDGAALHIPVDLTKPDTVPGVFERVRKELGGEVGVVVYNAAMFKPDPADPLSLFAPESIQTYHDSQSVNATSALVSLHEAVKSFRNLAASNDASKTFIFTGNMLNLKTLKGMLNFGLGKTSTAYAIRYLVENKIYAAEGVSTYTSIPFFFFFFFFFFLFSFSSLGSLSILSEAALNKRSQTDHSYAPDKRFYYADERNADGLPVGNAVSGPAAAEEYLKLAEQEEQGPWLYTFVKGEGYKDFETHGRL
ncbi:uncharacterized protein A1O5_03093 [Cladophialophora psammophila CBS 110553]|uniref:Short-chain dehydrogenase n=1 Tax=Cladophialophora psammophila CBS 110553 TaxID=1182543 RepID=W9WZJ5_9EURO|nr:uncharacterized protein A1O5_03093 [Cladophialophora psammophila CBS 110553]EXJ73333.1 hypothetical protein A1O5_03093 [Cladophialophora psammophila CBS 110553]